MSLAVVGQPIPPIVLGYTDSGDAVLLRYEDRTQHIAVIGKSGFGKTTVLEHLIVDDVVRGTGAIVLDAHGDLTQRIVEVTPPQAQERLVVVELNAECPFGLNLYECDSAKEGSVDATVDNVVEVFKKLFLDESNFYPVIEDGLRSSAYLIIANKWTLAEVPQVFRDRAFRRKALAAVTKRDVVDYWHEYEEMTTKEQRDQRRAVLNKVSPFLQRDLVSLMVSQSHTTIPFDEVFNRGATLLIRLAGNDNTTARQSVQFIGLVFLSVLSNIVNTRLPSVPREHRRRVHVYLDEYQRFASATTQQMLDDFRKYEIGITVAHQGLEGIGDRPPRAASMIVFQVDGADSQKLALNFDSTPVRTKKVMRLRHEPDYESVSRDVWDKPEQEAEYERLTRTAKELHEASCDALRRLRLFRYVVEKGRMSTYLNRGCECQDHTLQGWGIRSTKLVIALLDGEEWELTRFDHMLFNPHADYFYITMCDIAKEGKQATSTGLLRVVTLKSSYLGRGLYERDGITYEAYCLIPDAARHAWLVKALREASKEGFGERVKTNRESPTDADYKWLGVQGDELYELLRKLYRVKTFYMRADSADLERLGRPRPKVGSERHSYPNWPNGHWTVTLFPEGIEWLTAKVKALKSDSDKLSERAQEARIVAGQFRGSHHRVVVDKVLRGYKTVTKTVITGKRVTHHGGSRITENVFHDELVYDEVEEPAQSHAERTAEIATELGNLSKFHAYCKLLDQHGDPHEYHVSTSEPRTCADGAVSLESVVSRSRTKYGTPTQIVENQIRNREVIGDDPPIIGRRT